MLNKTDLRTKAKNIRKWLDIQKISQKACEKISNLEVYKTSKNILLFYPLEHEINTLSLISDEKNFYLPRIKENDLEICPYKIGDDLHLSKFKTKEPLTESVSPNILDLIIVPALMVDKNNYRLGYGKGFYDRLISQTQATTVLPIAKELFVENLPTEPHDKKIDIVILV